MAPKTLLFLTTLLAVLTYCNSGLISKKPFLDYDYGGNAADNFLPDDDPSQRSDFSEIPDQDTGTSLPSEWTWALDNFPQPESGTTTGSKTRVTRARGKGIGSALKLLAQASKQFGKLVEAFTEWIKNIRDQEGVQNRRHPMNTEELP